MRYKRAISLLLLVTLVLINVPIISAEEINMEDEVAATLKKANEDLQKYYGVPNSDFQFGVTTQKGSKYYINQDFLLGNSDETPFSSLIIYGEPHGDIGINKEDGKPYHRYLGYDVFGVPFSNIMYPEDRAYDEKWTYEGVHGKDNRIDDDYFIDTPWDRPEIKLKGSILEGRYLDGFFNELIWKNEQARHNLNLQIIEGIKITHRKSDGTYARIKDLKAFESIANNELLNDKYIFMFAIG